MATRTRARKTRSDVRQEQIVNAALALVGRQGMKALTIAGVAAEVGVVPSGIYRHFRGKDEVVDALLAMIGRHLQENVDAVCEDTRDAEERLRLLHIRHVRLIRENRGVPRFVFSESVYGGSSDRRKRLYEVIGGYRARVAEVVRRGQEEGTLRRDIAPEAVALMFLGLIQPAAILWHISNGSFDVTAETERCWRLFSQAIRPRPQQPVTGEDSP